MYQYHYYWNAAEDDHDKLEKLINISDDMHKKLKAYCSNDYYDMLTKMHCAVYGPHFDEKTAKMAVARMHNVDNTIGEHWTIDEVKNAASQHNMKYSADLYYVLNMLYSDFSKVIDVDIALYLKMAEAYICDPDGPEGKPFILWIAQMKAEKD